MEIIPNEIDAPRPCAGRSGRALICITARRRSLLRLCLRLCLWGSTLFTSSAAAAATTLKSAACCTLSPLLLLTR